MFEQTFVEGSGKTNKPWTTVVGFILQALVIGMAILVPMIWTDVLPAGQLKSMLVAPPPPPPPPPPPAETPKTVAVKVIPRQFDAGRLAQPKSVPNKVAVIEESELPPPSAGGGVVGGMAGGVSGGVLSGILGSTPAPMIAPPPPKVEEKKAVQRIIVGGKVQEAMLMKKVMPVYPPLARSTRIQGHVILNAVISKEGTIQELKVASGHPMLAPAAMEAVRQWIYRPTLLNGEPVEVTTEIDVNFTLQ
jgi:protein TonB